MAIRKLSEGISSWNSKTPFPKDRYQLTCIEEEFGKSKGGNPMITRTWEITAPELVMNGDKQLNVAGLQTTQYVTLKVKAEGGDGWDIQKSDKAFGRFRDEALTLGLDPDTEVDDENPPLIAKGKTVDAILYAREDVARKPPTPEQLRQGRRFGDEIKDVNNKSIKTYTLQIECILGVVEGGPTVAY